MTHFEPSGWQDRGKRGFWSRLLDNPDNPMGWSVRLFVFKAIDVRIHLITVLFIVGYPLSAIVRVGSNRWEALYQMVVGVAAMFTLVLIHEFGHCFAARRTGGEADQIVMLPFGGLALCRPNQNWRSHLITALGGPAVHIPIFIVLATTLALTGFASTILFNPFNPGPTLGAIVTQSSGTTRALQAVWIIHYVNMLLFCFNMLMVFYPFDGGRVVQSVLWRSMGYLRSMKVAVTVGIAGAIVVGVAGIITGQTVLFAIAAFGAIACFVERQRLTAADEITGWIPGADDGGGSGMGLTSMSAASKEPQDRGPSKKELKAEEREQRDQAELDRVLAKISAEGKDSLTKAERKFLEEMTKKQQSR